MEALFREAVEKILPFTESKKLQKIPKLTPMVRFPNRTGHLYNITELIF